MSGNFGTSMFGFKRERVIDYIEQITIEHNAEKTAITQKLNATQEALMQSQTENANLKESVALCEQQLADLRELALQLKQEVEKNNQLHEKIGDVFVEAKCTANRIIETATENAHTIVNSANNCAANTLEDIASAQTRLDSVRNELETMLSDFDQKLDSITRSLNSAKSYIKPTNGFTINTNITEDDLINSSVIKID